MWHHLICVLLSVKGNTHIKLESYHKWGYIWWINQLSFGIRDHHDPGHHLTLPPLDLIWRKWHHMLMVKVVPKHTNQQDPCQQVDGRRQTHRDTNKGTYFHCVVYKHRHAWTGHTANTYNKITHQVLRRLAKGPDSIWWNSKLVISGMVWECVV